MLLPPCLNLPSQRQQRCRTGSRPRPDMFPSQRSCLSALQLGGIFRLHRTSNITLPSATTSFAGEGGSETLSWCTLKSKGGSKFGYCDTTGNMLPAQGEVSGRYSNYSGAQIIIKIKETAFSPYTSARYVQSFLA